MLSAGVSLSVLDGGSLAMTGTVFGHEVCEAKPSSPGHSVELTVADF